MLQGGFSNRSILLAASLSLVGFVDQRTNTKNTQETFKNNSVLINQSLKERHVVHQNIKGWGYQKITEIRPSSLMLNASTPSGIWLNELIETPKRKISLRPVGLAAIWWGVNDSSKEDKFIYWFFKTGRRWLLTNDDKDKITMHQQLNTLERWNKRSNLDSNIYDADQWKERCKGNVGDNQGTIWWSQ